MSTTQNEFGPVPDKITLHRIKVNPDMVTEWLESMQSNRNVSQVHVHSIARKMRTGRWVDTGETIKFDWNGCLIDGAASLLGVFGIKSCRDGVPSDARPRSYCPGLHRH